MSNAPASVRFRDGLALHGTYHGTSDTVYSTLFASPEHVAMIDWHHLPSVERLPHCSCGQEPEVALVRCEYGSGCEWLGAACRRCSVLTSGTDPYSDPDTEFYPEGWDR